MRFALLEAKMSLAYMVAKYDITPCGQTPKTTTFDPESNLGTAKEPLIVNMRRRKNPSLN